MNRTERIRPGERSSAGSVAGVTGLASGQETTTEEGGQETPEGGGRERFFEEGTEVGTQVIAEGLTAPTDFAVPEGQGDRQYVTDQTEEVYVITDNGLREEPFINVSDRMVELGQFFGLYATRPRTTMSGGCSASPSI